MAIDVPWSTYFGSDTYQLEVADGYNVIVEDPVEATTPQSSATPALWIKPGGILTVHGEEPGSRGIFTRGNVRNQGTLIMTTDLHTVSQEMRFMPKTAELPGVDELLYTGGTGMTMVDRPQDIGFWTDTQGLNKIHGPYIRPWARVTGSLVAGQAVVTMKCDVEAQGWKVGHRLVFAPTRPITETERQLQKWFHHRAYSERTIVAISGATVTLDLGLQNDHPNYVQSVTGNVYTAEVMNMHRQVTLGGTAGARAHVHYHTHRADHELRNYRTEYMGPRKPDGNKTKEVQGAYGLHMHHAYDRSRGMVIFGLVMEWIGNHCYVTHESSGITLRGCVSHDTWEAAYWWDRASGHPGADTEMFDSVSNDIFWDRCVASKYQIATGSVTGFELRAGEGNHMNGCVSFGQNDANRGSGQSWPSLGGSAASGVWVPHHHNVVHNCHDHGDFTWSNIADKRHVVEVLANYRNGRSSLMNGAYGNRFTYFDGIHEENGSCVDHFSGSALPSSEDIATAHRAGHYRNYWNSSGRPLCFVSQHQRLGGVNWVDIWCNKLVNYSEIGFKVQDAVTSSNKNTPRRFSLEKNFFGGLPGSEPFWLDTEPLDGSMIRVDKCVCAESAHPFDETDAFILYPIKTTNVPVGAYWVPEWNCWREDVASFSTTTMEFDQVDRMYPQILELDDAMDLNAGLVTAKADTVEDRFAGTLLLAHRWVGIGTTAVNEKLTVTLAAATTRIHSAVYTPKAYDLAGVRTFAEAGTASATVDQYYELRTADSVEAVRWRRKADVLTAEVELDGVATVVGAITLSGGPIPSVWGFRGSEDGNSIFFETSSNNGESWDILGSTTSIDGTDALQHRLGAWAEDSIGGTAEFRGLNLVGSAAFIPTVGLWLSQPIPTGNWYHEHLYFEIRSDDPTATLEYAIDEGARVPYTEPVLLDEDGVFLVEAWATNASGESEPQHVLVQIDTTPPVTTAETSVVDGFLLLTLTQDDGEATGTSGEGDTYYRRVGSDTWLEYDGPIVMPLDGATYEFYSNDSVGNDEGVQTWTAPELFEYRQWISIGETAEADPAATATLLQDWGELEDLAVTYPWVNPGEYFWIYVQSRDALDLAVSPTSAQRFMAQLFEFRGWYSIGDAAVGPEQRLEWFGWSTQTDREEFPPSVPAGQRFWLYLQARDGSTLEEGPVATRTYVTVPDPAVVTAPFIASGSQVFAPTILPGPRVLVPSIIAATSTVFTPTLDPTSVPLEPVFISSTVQVFNPAITEGVPPVTITPSLIGSTATVHAATITRGIRLAPGFIASSAAIYSPTIVPGSLVLLPAFIASGSQVFAPEVVAGTPDPEVFAPPLVVSTSAVFTPTIVPGSLVLLPAFIASGYQVFAPVLVAGVPYVPVVPFSLTLTVASRVLPRTGKGTVGNADVWALVFGDANGAAVIPDGPVTWTVTRRGRVVQTAVQQPGAAVADGTFELTYTPTREGVYVVKASTIVDGKPAATSATSRTVAD